MKKKVNLIIILCIIIISAITELNIESIRTTFFSYQLNQYIEKNTSPGNRISAYIYKFNDNKTVAVNNNYKYMPASMMKLTAMLAYYKKAEDNPDILQQKIIYQPNIDKPLTQNIAPEKTLASGSAYTVDDLIKRMIIYSDNRSSNLLFDHLSDSALTDTFTSIGLNRPNFDDTYYTISTSDLAKFFIELYNPTYLNQTYAQKSIKLLEQTEFKDGIVAGVPSNITVAHKFGERKMRGTEVVNQFHECGIVYKPYNPYLLCVMTDGNDIFQQTKLVRSISQFVYQNIP